MVHRASLGKFGDAVIESNRDLIPGPWEQDQGAGFHEWEPTQAVYLTGTPPCSGFSLLNNSKKGNKRGPESSINDCMRELIAYAGSKVTGQDGKKGPEIVSFESVQGAFKQGRSLMQWLRADLEKRTGQKYDLTHVCTSGSTIGAAQMRHRYYFVAHRVPFGVNTPEKRRVVTYLDALGDLTGLKDQWESQKIKNKKFDSWWLDEQDIRSEDVLLNNSIDAHIGADNPRVRIMIDQLEPYWPSGKSVETALRNYREKNGDFPEGTHKWWDHDKDIMKGFAHPTRINKDRPGYVCTGGCVFDFVHWKEPRFLSVRECARLMGYPDSWTWSAASTVSQAGAYVGKCCPVTTGRWISNEVRNALEGNPGTKPVTIGDREYLHDSTLLYKPWLKEQQATT